MKNKKTIFIITFIIIIIIIIGILIFSGKSDKENKGGVDLENKIFNPFNTTDKNNTGGITTKNTDTGIDWKNNNFDQKSRFYQITDYAVAGASFFEEKRPIPKNKKDYTQVDITTNTNNTAIKKTSQKNILKFEMIPLLRYVERVTGHIYQMDLNTKNITKISNSTIPGVYEVLINNFATTFIYRYLSKEDNNITSFMATLGDTKGEFLPSNIIKMSLSPNKDKVFYLVKNSNGVVGFILSFKNNKKSQIFTSSFSEWTSQWVTNRKIFLTTKPSWQVSGSLFSLDIINGTLTKIFGGVDGLTTLTNNDSSQVLYGASLVIGPKLWLLNTKDHTTKNLDIYGLPEKCVWSGDNIYIYCAIPNTIIGIQYPDYWYQGLVSFDDYFVKINTQTAQRSTLANSINEIPVDATHLFLDKEENTLFFINKKDSTLWSLDL